MSLAPTAAVGLGEVVGLEGVASCGEGVDGVDGVWADGAANLGGGEEDGDVVPWARLRSGFLAASNTSVSRRGRGAFEKEF